jgi:hypothetical protein
MRWLDERRFFRVHRHTYNPDEQRRLSGGCRDVEMTGRVVPVVDGRDTLPARTAAGRVAMVWAAAFQS